MHDPYAPPESSLSPDSPDAGARHARTSMILGLVSIVTWLLPIIGLPTTIAGIVYGIRGLGPGRRGQAVTGLTLSIVFLILTILNVAWGVYLAATGQHPLVNRLGAPG